MNAHSASLKLITYISFQQDQYHSNITYLQVHTVTHTPNHFLKPSQVKIEIFSHSLKPYIYMQQLCTANLLHSPHIAIRIHIFQNCTFLPFPHSPNPSTHPPSQPTNKKLTYHPPPATSANREKRDTIGIHATIPCSSMGSQHSVFSFIQRSNRNAMERATYDFDWGTRNKTRTKHGQIGPEILFA